MSRFIELTHARYATELGKQLADVDLFFTDEPQFGSAEHWGGGNAECVPMIQWCDELPVAFGEKKGYDLVEILPALFHQAGPEDEQVPLRLLRRPERPGGGELLRPDRRLVPRAWRCLQRAHAARRVVAVPRHVQRQHDEELGADGPARRRPAGASPYKTMAGWERGQFPVAEDFSCKMASSVAHLTGKQGVFTESFALASKVALRQILGVAAWQFSGGITHMSTYTIQQQLSAEDYARFSDFVGRMAVLARRGRHVADVAVLVPEASVWASYTPPDRGRYEGYFARNPEPLAIDRVFRETCNASPATSAISIASASSSLSKRRSTTAACFWRTSNFVSSCCPRRECSAAHRWKRCGRSCSQAEPSLSLAACLAKPRPGRRSANNTGGEEAAGRFPAKRDPSGRRVAGPSWPLGSTSESRPKSPGRVPTPCEFFGVRNQTARYCSWPIPATRMLKAN